MNKVIVIHGPNLNMLGKREPDIYGEGTLKELNDAIQERAGELGLKAVCHQLNSESKIIELLQEHRTDVTGIIINPAGYSHTSVAILDALLAVEVPVVEVHLTNIFSREDFRQTSLTAAAADGIISGLGGYSYLLALDYIAQYLED